MYKTTIVLLALCAQLVFGAYTITVTNKAKKQVDLVIQSGKRVCVCLTNTQTKSLKGKSAGSVKLFRSNNCRGDYDVMGSNGFVDNAFWVNSLSYGKSGIPSEDPRWCPNYFNLNVALGDVSRREIRADVYSESA
ncbi:hypothetical protein BGW41_002343 [Actinomortierella wolfii]|nr:hypothetical protein BGW41_002343 [Actinomortierella wolfii]